MEYLARVISHIGAVCDDPPLRTRCRCRAGRLLALCQRCSEWSTMGCSRMPDETGRTIARLLTSETEWCDEWTRRHDQPAGE